MRNRSLHAEGFVRADEDNVVTEQNLCLAFHNDEQMVVRVGVRGVGPPPCGARQAIAPSLMAPSAPNSGFARKLT